MEELTLAVSLLIFSTISSGHALFEEYPPCEGTSKVVIKFPLLDGFESYWVCKDGSGKIVHCLKGRIYDTTTESCQLRTDAERLRGTADTADGFIHPDCPSVDPQEPVFLPHPIDCSKFYICSGGRAHEKQCSNGLHFSPRLRVCDYPDNAKCSLRNVFAQAPQQRCPEKNSATALLLPHESDCRSYYICESGKAILRACPPNLHFNPKKSVCDHPEEAGCSSKKDVTSVVPKPKVANVSVTTATPEVTGKPSPFCPKLDGQYPIFFRHPINCSVYYMCGNGLAYEFVCSDGLHFNTELNVCDYPHNVNCLRGKDAVVSSTATATTFRCPRGPIVRPSYHPHPANCNKYYVCFDGRMAEKKCPNGLHFNAAAKVCDYPGAAKCQRVI